MDFKCLNPEEIRLDGDTQPRVRLDQSTVEEYAEAMERRDLMPPVDVFYDGENYWLADGFHRYHAMTRIDSHEPIECKVHKGSLDDAKWFSYSANKDHGLRRSNKDKAKAVKAALVHTNGAEMSDRQLAGHVGVGKTMVSRYRNEMESSGLIDQIDTRTAKRNGKTYKQNTSNIGKRPAKTSKSAKPDALEVKAFRPRRRHSKMSPMISLTLPVNKPEVTAAALWQEFPVSYIETLIQVFTKYIQDEKKGE